MSRIVAYQQKCELYYDKWLQSTMAGLGAHHQNLEKEWNAKNIWKSAPDAQSMLHGFKHIIEVDWRKVLHKNNKAGKYYASDEFFTEFCYPYRELGDHTFVIVLRGVEHEDGTFELMEVGAEDKVFAATNNDEDATFIALKYK